MATDDFRAACVIGWPVEHSRSPLIYNYWLKQYRLDAVYRREEIAPEAFADFLAHLAERGYVGANITIPHKEAALAMSEPDDRAQRGRRRQHALVRQRDACFRPTPTSKASPPISTPAFRVGRSGSAKRWCSAPAVRRAPSSTA